MKNFKIAKSEARDSSEAVKSIREQLSGVDACLVIYFVSSTYPVEKVAKEMAEAFTGARTVGCTSYGEMISGEIGQNSIVAMACDKATMKFLQIEVLENIKENYSQAIDKAFKSFEDSTGISMHQLDASRFVGMMMIDGLSGREEKINDYLGNLTNVPFIGGSAADDFSFQTTWMFLDGKTYTNAAIFVLMEPANGYITLKTQSFNITDKKLIPTKVDEDRRLVIEFDGKPASEAYSEALGIPIDELAKDLGEYPVGLIFDENNYFVRSPKQIEGTAIAFYCLVKEGLEVRLLEHRDIVATTREDLQKCGKVQALIDFNCAQRFTELVRNNQLKDYSEIFEGVSAVGFATYGESYIGHINQTSTILLLK